MLSLELVESIRKQNENRTLWVENDDAPSLAVMIRDEADELVEAINESLLTGDVFSVVSEVGDLLYLLHRLCIDTGINPDDAVEMKLMRNSYKYADYVMSNGRSLPEARRAVKETWKYLGGDIAFSHAYLDVLANECPPMSY